MPLLLVGILVLLWAIVSAHRSRLGLGALSRRGALVLAFLVFEALMAVITESASVGHNLTAGVVDVVWAIVFVALLAVVVLDIRRTPRRVSGSPPRHAARRGVLGRLSTEELLWSVVLLGIFGVLVFIGWVYPPSNGDSMVYHLARVAHWEQNRSVTGFATHYLAQIELAPLAEYNMLQLHLLSGGDRLDGYVQLLSAVVSVAGVSEIARLLGGGRRVQMTAAVLCATIPTGILEATSTENNFFAAAVAVALLMTLLAMRLDRRWAGAAVILGFAVGSAVIAKGTIPAYVAPVTLLLSVLVIRRGVRADGAKVALRRVMGTGAVAVVCALAVAGPFLARNIELFGAPTGPVSASTLSTDLTVRAAGANVIRSTASNFFIGNGRSGFETEVSKVALGFFRRLYTPLHVSQSDTRYLVGSPTDAFKVMDWAPFTTAEDFGAAPWDVLLLMATGIVLAVGVARRRRELKVPLLVAIGLAAGFVLFTGTARWSVFQVRYQLPVLVAGCALIAVALGRFHRWVGRIILAALVVACLPQLLDNSERPVLHPEYHFTSYLQPYFLDGTLKNYQVATAGDYESATQSLVQSSCPRVGLANWVLVEYPIWAGLRHDNWTGTLDDVDVDNQSSTFESPDFHPCAWIRQESPGYVGSDNGTVDLQFGQLAVEVGAARASSIRVRVPGFTSQDRGVTVLPGGGWSLADPHAPRLAGSGSVYVYAKTPQQVQIRLPEARDGHIPVVVQSGGTTTTLSPDRSGTVVITTDLTPGPNRFHLSTPGPAGHTGSPLAFTAVRVLPATGN